MGMPSLTWRYLSLAALLLAAPAPAPAEPARPTVCLVPLGRHDAALLAVARAGIEHLYGWRAELRPAEPLPRAAFYRPRRRYRAEKLLAHLTETLAPSCTKVVGFTAVDISTTKGTIRDWGVLGLADLGGPAAVVSTYRMARRARGRRQVARRTVNVVNHELGHALGLDHDAVPGCIMNDAQGTVLTVDRETGLFCAESRRLVEERHGPLPARAAFDWDAVLSTL
jgi:archaemetzincin